MDHKTLRLFFGWRGGGNIILLFVDNTSAYEGIKKNTSYSYTAIKIIETYVCMAKATCRLNSWAYAIQFKGISGGVG